MRLSETERNIICESARRQFGEQATVYLFGSRVDDKARGGDIDLFIECAEPAGDLLSRELKLYADLQRQLGEQKIDIVSADPLSPRLPIHEQARRTGVRL